MWIVNYGRGCPIVVDIGDAPGADPRKEQYVPGIHRVVKLRMSMIHAGIVTLPLGEYNLALDRMFPTFKEARRNAVEQAREGITARLRALRSALVTRNYQEKHRWNEELRKSYKSLDSLLEAECTS